MTDAQNQSAATDNSATGGQHETLRDRATHAYESAVNRTGEAMEDTRDKARDAAHQAGGFIQGSPLGALAGGLAIGALVGALVPRGEREKELLAPVGKRVGTAALAAIAAAKQAGHNELGELGLTKEAAREQAKSLFQGVVKAASHAGTAAAQAGREQIKSSQ